MRVELLCRREELLRVMVRGVSVKAAAERMARDVVDPCERVRVVAAIRRDWGNRDRWMVNVVRLAEGTFLAELVAGMDEAMKQLWADYYRTKNCAVRVGILRAIILGKSRLGLLLLKAGVIQSAPLRVDSMVKIAGTPFDCDPELRRALVAESEKQREEKNTGLLE